MSSYSLKIFFSAFTFFFTVFFKWEGLDPTLLGWANNGLILGFLCVNYKSIRMLIEPTYKWINLFAVLWAILILYSSYINQDLSYDLQYWDSASRSFEEITKGGIGFKSTAYFVLKILMFILYFEYQNKFHRRQEFLKYFFWCLLLYVIISDVSAFVYNADGIEHKTGTKFYVCYLNIILLSTYLMRFNFLALRRKQRIFVNGLFILTFLLSIRTQCTTMIIGVIVFYYLLYKLKGKSKLYKPGFYLFGLFVFDILFLLIINWILTIPVVQYIIVDILKEDLTLTGRVGIYAKLGAVLNERPLIGFGWGNSYVTSLMYEIGSNLQNGLLNMYIEIGLLGCFLYLTLIIFLMKYSIKNKSSYPIICFIYMMLVLSSIEIIYTNYFTSFVTLLLLNDAESVKQEKGRNYYRTSFA